MDAGLKIQILLFVLLGGVLMVGFMVIIQSIGSINHVFDRLEEIVTKETILRFERINKEISIRESAKRAEEERRRRNEALLNVPLMRGPGEGEEGAGKAGKEGSG